MLRVSFTILFACVLFSLRSQDRCGTVAYEKLRSLRNPKGETIDQFETWIKDKLVKKSQAFKDGRVTSTNYVIPIVVHVIHNGETLGTGTNISDAQILSQIKVLNDDFARLNADTTKTPAEFIPVAGKFTITFVMAKQDPNGDPTNGIRRVKGTQPEWDIPDNYTLKALDYWPAEDYLNIWIADLSGGLLGYTQLPVSSTLQGLSDSSNDRLTDGVVIDYSAYGTVSASGGGSFNLQSKYNLGRTTTHEVGHFFGLRHVWGDVNSCDPSVSTDYVDDTPIQNTNFNGLCPSGTQVECGVHSMYDNYLNYTDDACMNIFSKGQVARMDVIINNSPRRVSLLTSPALQPPAPVADDLGIKSISNPGATACSGNLTPSILVHNYGSNNVTAVQVKFLVNGTLTDTQTRSALNLLPDAETSISFSPLPVSEGISYNFSFTILQTNGVTDGNSSNNSLSVSTLIPLSASLPLSEQFNTTPPEWQIINQDGLITWSNVSLSGSNHAMYMDFYDYPDQQGTPDFLITPVLDLTNASVASLNFDYAYAPFQSGSTDQLRVLVSTVCNFSASPLEVFNKSGTALATSAATGSAFVPASSSQWATTVISLNQFLGQKIQIAFEGINGYGNNLYLDNVAITNIPKTDFALTSLVSPSPVSCKPIVEPVISVTNLGNVSINAFAAKVYLNDQLTVEQISGIQLDIGATANFTLAPLSLLSGTNQLSIAITSPNGVLLPAASKDSLNTALMINSASDIIPIRENFDDNFVDKWSTINPQSGIDWHGAATNKSTSMLFPSFGSATLGQQAWLVSPSLDFSKAQAASVNFETSYAYSTTGIETLQVFSSKDCGVTFDTLLFNMSGVSLSNINLNTGWTPSKDSDWTKNYINLDRVVGKENVRLAFVATNGDGNNLYIDNIEFFMDDLQTRNTVGGLYSVYGGVGTPVKVTFNLPERELVRMQVYDLLGHVVSDNLLPDTLNQTYTIDFPEESRGLYVVRIQTASSLGATKVLLGF